MSEKPVTIDQDDDEDEKQQSRQPITVHHLPAQRKAKPPAEKKTAGQIVAQAKLLQNVMEQVMRPDVHYGIIPGTDKPALYKAGSEVLLTTFRVAVIPEIFDLSDNDCVKYRVLAHGVHQVTGVTLGVGVGECSTNEEKYRWRAAVCQEEYDETDDEKRRIKWKKGYQNNPPQRLLQVRTEPADLANTVLKMAKKRAQIDLTLTATGASDIFTQDIDEEGNLVPRADAPQPARQQRASSTGTGSGRKATDKQVDFMQKKLDESSKDIEDLKEKFSVDSLAEVTMDQVNAVLDWLK